MKKYWFLLLFLLLLTGCGGREAADQPYGLEIEYGDSGVLALQSTAQWSWVPEDGSPRMLESKGVDPFSVLSQVPFVNESKASRLKLLFEQEPDAVTVTCWSSSDGYSEQRSVELTGGKLKTPEDGSSYLYRVEAAWEQGKKDDCWGSCIYYFRFLPKDATGDQSGAVSLYRLVQLQPSELFGVEVFNNLDAQWKTCRSEQDKLAILEYLRENLTTSFLPVELEAPEADYVLRLAMTDGSQLTLGYGSEGKTAWLLLGGQPYAAELMDLYPLWQSLTAQTVSLQDDLSSAYLQVSEDFPGDGWGTQFVYGYLKHLEQSVTYDEVHWIDDADAANGYVLQAGQTGCTLPLAEDCQFWLLEEHAGPWCRVERETLWQWAETTGWDVLFRLYARDGEIVAVCEQYVP